MAGELLVITLGTSDLQIDSKHPNIEKSSKVGYQYGWTTPGGNIINLKTNRSRTDAYLIGSPRNDGKNLLYEINDILDDLIFPLISPFLEYLKKDMGLPDKVLIVHTDQEDADERYRLNDTLYFSEIFKRWLIHHEGMNEKQIECYAVNKCATDIDILYENFRQKGLELSKINGGFETVYLLAQGGIDQINHALTLQLIHLFKNRLKHYQVSESGVPQKLNFPNLFLKDLSKQNIIKHAIDYDFEKIDISLCDEKWVIQFCEYASDHLSLSHSNKSYENLRKANLSYRKKYGSFSGISNYVDNWDKLKGFQKNRIKLRDLYFAMKIKYYQNNYNDFLWRTFTLIENLYKCEIDEYCQIDSKYTFNGELKPEETNEKFREFIEKIQYGLYDELKSKGIYFHNPTRRAYKLAYDRLLLNNILAPKLEPSILQKIESVIDEWSKRRNGVAHKLGTILKSEIDSEITKMFRDSDEFFYHLDQFMGVSGLGEYDIIRDLLLKHYY